MAHDKVAFQLRELLNFVQIILHELRHAFHAIVHDLKGGHTGAHSIPEPLDSEHGNWRELGWAYQK